MTLFQRMFYYSVSDSVGYKFARNEAIIMEKQRIDYNNFLNQTKGKTLLEQLMLIKMSNQEAVKLNPKLEELIGVTQLTAKYMKKSQKEGVNFNHNQYLGWLYSKYCNVYGGE